jgi:glutamyl-tRNA synthetase
LSEVDWQRATINEAIKAVIREHKLKLPKIAMPLRVLVTGTTQTPSIDATLELIGRDAVLARLDKQLGA